MKKSPKGKNAAAERPCECRRKMLLGEKRCREQAQRKRLLSLYQNPLSRVGRGAAADSGAEMQMLRLHGFPCVRPRSVEPCYAGLQGSRRGPGRLSTIGSLLNCPRHAPCFLLQATSVRSADVVAWILRFVVPELAQGRTGNFMLGGNIACRLGVSACLPKRVDDAAPEFHYPADPTPGQRACEFIRFLAFLESFFAQERGFQVALLNKFTSSECTHVAPDLGARFFDGRVRRRKCALRSGVARCTAIPRRGVRSIMRRSRRHYRRSRSIKNARHFHFPIVPQPLKFLLCPSKRRGQRGTEPAKTTERVDGRSGAIANRQDASKSIALSNFEEPSRDKGFLLKHFLSYS